MSRRVSEMNERVKVKGVSKGARAWRALRGSRRGLTGTSLGLLAGKLGLPPQRNVVFISTIYETVSNAAAPRTEGDERGNRNVQMA